MKFRPKIIKQILKEFDIIAQISDISQWQISYPIEQVFLCQFRFKDTDWAIVLNEDENLDEILPKIAWHEQAQIISKNDQNSLIFQQKTCILLKKDDGTERLDVILAKKYPTYSRTRLQKMIKTGQIKVNNEIINKIIKINPSAEIEIIELKSQPKKPLKLTILYEDDEIMAIDKPAGILTHAVNEYDDNETTIADFARPYLNFKGDYRAGIVHRLDRATSGVILIAKTKTAQTYLKQQFKHRFIQKTYLAIVSGQPKHPEAKIDLPLARQYQQASKFWVDPAGKPSTTIYKTLKHKDGRTLLEVKPKTGRTHQIRVHLAYLGLPIIGDYLYGGQKHKRLLLHASQIEFRNGNNQLIVVKSPLPEDFKW